MDDLREQIEQLESTANLTTSIDDVQHAIDLLTAARDKIAKDCQAAPMTLAKLKEPLRKTMDTASKDLKPMYSVLNKYSKALDKKFKDKPLPTAENDALSSHPQLINRAIAMHLLREGEFAVASTFIDEAATQPPRPEPTPGTPNPYLNEAWEREMATGTFNSAELQQNFAKMYHVLHELRQRHDLTPAIEWAKANSSELEARGSNLEFELTRLQFVSHFTGHSPRDPHLAQDIADGPLQAWTYARTTFAPFQLRYSRELQQLMGALAYSENMTDSPYRRYFYNESAFEEVATSFTREFCSLIGLSADSPLYLAATAGAIALPTLLKLQNIMKEKRTEWTTQNELPVEIPLPPSYHFHSIFVCPVSKEQSTDQNPPMMMTCGHVIAQESLDKLSKGARFKCPYCPSESHPRDAKKVFL